MFKSVFTKYITVFMLIIAISFMLLTLILCQMVNTWSQDAKADIVERSAAIVAEASTEMFLADGTDNFNRFVYFSRDQFEQLLTALSEYSEDVHILLLDKDGAILAHDEGIMQGDIKAGVPESLMENVKNNGAQRVFGELDGMFDEKHLVHLSPINDANGEFVGATLAFSSHSRSIC